MLLTFALVYDDWQNGNIFWKDRRGYNIGALLINEHQEPVYHSLNSVTSANNITQHAEVKAMLAFLDKSKRFDLSGFTLYCTLEPCIMCAGMTTMTGIKRVVYGQRDLKYNNSFERINRNIEINGRENIYPVRSEVYVSPDEFTEQLNILYKEFLVTDNEKILAKFLASEAVRIVFQKASNEFVNFKPRSEQELTIYKQAAYFYEKEKKRLPDP